MNFIYYTVTFRLLRNLLTARKNIATDLFTCYYNIAAPLFSGFVISVAQKNNIGTNNIHI